MTGSTRRSSSSAGTGSAPGPRRLAADVEDVRALVDHPQPVVDRRAGIEAHAAVGKRIRRDVEDPHDERALAQLERRAARKRNGVALRVEIMGQTGEGHEAISWP